MPTGADPARASLNSLLDASYVGFAQTGSGRHEHATGLEMTRVVVEKFISDPSRWITL